MTTKEEVWTTVWVVLYPLHGTALYGPIAGMYTTEAAAKEHAAEGPDQFTVVEWAASNRYSG